MVLTITPMVHGGQRIRWGASVILHAIGGAIGGAVAAFAALFAVRVVTVWLAAPALPLALVILALSLLTDARALPVKVPSPRRQVPERWRAIFSTRLTAFLYGVGLGMGVTTRVYFAATYAVFLVAALLLDFPFMLAVGGVFGLARGLSIWIAHDGASLEALEKAIRNRVRYRVAARIANVVTLGAVALALALTST